MIPLVLGALWTGTVMYLRQSNPADSVPDDENASLLSSYNHMVDSQYAPIVLFLLISVSLCCFCFCLVGAFCVCYYISRVNAAEERRFKMMHRNAQTIREHSIRMDDEESDSE